MHGLDERGASFVSVTQSFSTVTSVGRLTLNVLLSFAQFERELTGERIRDKISASKAKGIWMGGNPPLGYDVQERKLIVNPDEAEAVRHIMQRYVALGTGRALIEELRTTGYRTKRARTRGGNMFERGALFHLLSNRIYLGEIVHKGTPYPGEHDAIVPIALWDAVQQRIAENRVERREASNIRDPSLLAGLLSDGLGRRMSPSHAVKGRVRYRYYTTPASELTDATQAWRVPAHDLEAAVVTRLHQMLEDRSFILTTVQANTHDADASAVALSLAAQAAVRINQYRHKKAMIRTLVRAVRLADDHVAIDVDRSALAHLLGVETPSSKGHDIVTIIARATRIRRGKDVRLVVADGNGRANAVRDDTLVALLAESQVTLDAMLAVPDRSIKQLARDTGRCRTRVANLLKVAQLAPDIVERCLDGTHPAGLTPRILIQANLPLAWSEQRTLLGFA